MKKNLVKVRDVLPATPSLPTEPVPLEREQPHKALARANARHAKLTEELRTLKSDFAAENIRAQKTRTPISTSRITHVETRRRELHLELEKAQAEIGRLNKAIRENKAQRQGNGSKRPARLPEPKKMPFVDDPEFPAWFHLASKGTLAPALYAELLRTTKAMMYDARRGLE
jgi:hypothetical protein